MQGGFARRGANHLSPAAKAEGRVAGSEAPIAP
jgi:hypothetical protein